MFNGYFTTMSPYKLTFRVMQQLKISSAKLVMKLATKRFFHYALPYLSSVTAMRASLFLEFESPQNFKKNSLI